MKSTTALAATLLVAYATLLTKAERYHFWIGMCATWPNGTKYSDCSPPSTFVFDNVGDRLMMAGVLGTVQVSGDQQSSVGSIKTTVEDAFDDQLTIVDLQLIKKTDLIVIDGVIDTEEDPRKLEKINNVTLTHPGGDTVAVIENEAEIRRLRGHRSTQKNSPLLQALTVAAMVVAVLLLIIAISYSVHWHAASKHRPAKTPRTQPVVMEHEPTVLISLTLFALISLLTMARVAFVVSWDELMITGRGLMECDGRGECPVTKTLSAIFVLWSGMLGISGYHLFCALSHVAFPFTRGVFPTGRLFGLMLLLAMSLLFMSIYATHELNNYPGRVVVPGGTYLVLSILLVITSGIGEFLCGITAERMHAHSTAESKPSRPLASFNGRLANSSRKNTIEFDNPLFNRGSDETDFM